MWLLLASFGEYKFTGEYAASTRFICDSTILVILDEYEPSETTLVISAQSCISALSLDKCWFRWIIYMFRTQLVLSCVMVIIALILILVTCISI